MTYRLDTASQRAAIASAVTLSSTVDGKPVQTTGYLYQPDTINAYDAWPQLVRGRVTTRCFGETDWSVLCALPGADLQSAAAAADALLENLIDACLGLGQITLWQPARIAVIDQPQAWVPGLQIDLTI